MEGEEPHFLLLLILNLGEQQTKFFRKSSFIFLDKHDLELLLLQYVPYLEHQIVKTKSIVLKYNKNIISNEYRRGD